LARSTTGRRNPSFIESGGGLCVAAAGPTRPGQWFPREKETASVTRIPRLGLLSLVLLGVLGVIALFAWQAASESGADQWSYSKLLPSAQVGRVRAGEIGGSSATATSGDGLRHSVTLSDTTEALAQELTRDNVDVTYQQANGAGVWLQVLLPNLILILLIGG